MEKSIHQVLFPGVFVQETPSAVQTITTGFETSVVAFFGAVANDLPMPLFPSAQFEFFRFTKNIDWYLADSIYKVSSHFGKSPELVSKEPHLSEKVTGHSSGMNYLELELERLIQLEDIILKTPVYKAPHGCWIEIYRTSRKGCKYARLTSDSPIFDGNKTQVLGREGSPPHKTWQKRIAKRNMLNKILSRKLTLRNWINDPLF